MRKRIFVVTLLCLIFQSNLWAKRVAKTLFTEGSLKAGRWRAISSEEKTAIKSVLELINRSPTGTKLIDLANKQASKLGGKLIDFIKSGAKSYTDTTLVRRFSPDEPENVEYRTKSVVFLNSDLGIVEAVLDLSHELTHFTFRSPFNPYGAKFKAKNFISSTIEGRGGEVDAYLMECRILDELFAVKVKGRFQCQQIRDPKTGHFSRAQGIKRFYQMGGYIKPFKTQLNKLGLSEKSMTPMGDEDAMFFSSAYGVPYPYAALQEFAWVKERVCQNELKRIRLIERKNMGSSSASNQPLTSLKKSYNQRCK